MSICARGRGLLQWPESEGDLGNMQVLLWILFVLDALALITLVLLQMSKHAGLGGAFGGGGTHTVFGRDETSDPKRTATAWLAAIFMILALSLSLTT